MHRYKTPKVYKYLLIFLAVLFFPAISSAQSESVWSAKLGWFMPSEESSYGKAAYDEAKRISGSDTSSYASPSGFTQFNFTGGRKWDNGFGVELGIRTPYIMYVEVRCTGGGCGSVDYDYTRIVWPALAVTLRYNLFDDSTFSPYLGVGVGGVYVYTEASGVHGTADNSEVVGSVHVMGGVRIGRMFHAEIRHESTGKPTKSSNWYNDDGDLGGTYASLGIEW
jgi:opacity protein-like surface antigen